jgi:hypothetical protein
MVWQAGPAAEASGTHGYSCRPRLQACSEPHLLALQGGMFGRYDAYYNLRPWYMQPQVRAQAAAACYLEPLRLQPLPHPLSLRLLPHPLSLRPLCPAVGLHQLLQRWLLIRQQVRAAAAVLRAGTVRVLQHLCVAAAAALPVDPA